MSHQASHAPAFAPGWRVWQPGSILYTGGHVRIDTGLFREYLAHRYDGYIANFGIGWFLFLLNLLVREWEDWCVSGRGLVRGNAI